MPLLIRLNCLDQLARKSDPPARDVRALKIQDSLSYEIQIQSQTYYICDIFNITKITASNYRALAGAGALAARSFSLGSVNFLNVYWGN